MAQRMALLLLHSAAEPARIRLVVAVQYVDGPEVPAPDSESTVAEIAVVGQLEHYSPDLVATGLPDDPCTVA